MKKRWTPVLLSILFIVSSCTAARGAEDDRQSQMDSAPQEKPAPSLEAVIQDQVDAALIWKADAEAAGYVLYRAEEEKGPYMSVALISPATQTETISHVDSFLEAGRTYYYKLQPYYAQDGYKTYGSISDPVSVQIAAYSGYFHRDGALYYYDRNRLITDKEVNGLYFDHSGRYSSKNEELDRYLRQITSECIRDEMTQLEKFRAVYDWVIQNCSYLALPFVEGTDWEPEIALEMFKTHQGNCFYYAAAVAMLARNTGLQARAVTGSCYQTYTWVDHSWTEVVLEGTTYLCDAEMEGVFAAEEGWVWDLFMKEYGTTPNEYSLQ